MVDFTQGYIRNAVFGFEELSQMAIGPVILLHGSWTDGYALDFFEVVEVLPEQREQSMLTDRMAHKSILYLFGGDVKILLL